MQNINRAIIGFILFLALCLPAQAQTAARREVDSTTKQSVEFGAQGTIQLVDSFGSVRLEGWDKDEVELTFNKQAQEKYLRKNPTKVAQELERVSVEMDLVEESTLLAIRTVCQKSSKANLKLDYLIKVPRQSTLLIKHGAGEVLVTNVSGDIEATVGKGKMLLELPENQTYAVNARARFGEAYSEFGYTKWHRGSLSIGCTLVHEPATATRRIFLRIGTGVIQINKLPMRQSAELSDRKALQ
jgi:hypothetical protein